MKTRTIIASDMQEAMAQAKKAFGDDAIILSSQRFADHIELIVTDDVAVMQQHEEEQRQKKAKKEAERLARKQAEQQQTVERKAAAQAQANAVDTDAFDKQIKSVPDFADLLANRKDEIAARKLADDKLSLSGRAPTHSEEDIAASREQISDTGNKGFKKMLGDLKSIGEYWNSLGVYWDKYAESYQYPWNQELRERLDNLHLEKGLREKLIHRYREIPEIQNSWQLSLNYLESQLSVQSHDIIRTGGAFVFAGPSGAGKTTTISKIAAEYVLQHGSEEVALITTDIFRIAAYEQLLSLGKILDVDVEVVDVAQGGLARALRKFSDKSLVLVDTAGLGRNDADLAAQLREIKMQGQQLQQFVVVPANVQYGSMQDIIDTYSVDDHCACILTKLDECSSLGPALSLAINNNIPVAYSASGHSIPDDLLRPSTRHLLEQMLFMACKERDLSLLQDVTLSELVGEQNDRQMGLNF
jgi:flagellar biosynthesis protein FlhF